MIYGTWTAYSGCTACTVRPFGNSLSTVPWLEKAGYIGISALAVNLLVLVALTLVLRGMKVDNGTDVTRRSDYFADVGDPGVRPVLDVHEPIK